MKITITAFLDELYGILSQSSELVNLFAQKEASSISSLNSWLIESEEILKKYHRPEMSEIAAIRARLLSASNGVYEKNFFLLPSAGSSRKIFQAGAAILFNNAQTVLKNTYNVFYGYRAEAEKFTQQMLLISLQKGSFYPAWNNNLPMQEKLTKLWQSFTVDKDLVQGTRQILSSVHYLDALRILDEIITDLNL